MNKREFIARIASDLRQYDESNLIDYRVVREAVDDKLKRFGNNIMVNSDKLIKVVDGKAKLPDNFWKLNLAVKCEPEGYSVKSGDKRDVISSFMYKQRTEESLKWNNSIESYVKTDHKVITETVKIDLNVVDFYYKQPTALRLTKGMKRDVCSATCKNLQDAFTRNSPWEISIINKILYANFDKGYIYIQFAGLPLDEEGEIEIPDTQHNHLKTYLQYHCKALIMENLMGNGDDPNLINMYKLYSSKESEYFSLAMTEVKMESLGHDWDVKMKNKMRRGTLKYESMFPK